MNESVSSAKALLKMGEKAKDVAEKTGLSYQKVLAIKKSMIADDTQRELGDIVAMDPVALDIIVEKAKSEAPKRVVKEIERIQEGVTGLQKLDGEFHTTFSLVLSKAEDYLSREDLKASEWVAITNALSSAYNNIYNNSGVSVNVDNSTKVSSHSLSMFKGSLRE